MCRCVCVHVCLTLQFFFLKVGVEGGAGLTPVQHRLLLVPLRPHTNQPRQWHQKNRKQLPAIIIIVIDFSDLSSAWSDYRTQLIFIGQNFWVTLLVWPWTTTSNTMTHHIVTADVSRNCSDSWWTDRETGNKMMCFLFTHSGDACVRDPGSGCNSTACSTPTNSCWGFRTVPGFRTSELQFYQLVSIFCETGGGEQSDANMLRACLWSKKTRESLKLVSSSPLWRTSSAEIEANIETCWNICILLLKNVKEMLLQYKYSGINGNEYFKFKVKK